jgi:hypothetical protein
MPLQVLYERRVPGEVHGIALDGTRLLANVGGKLQVFDEHGAVAPAVSRWKAGDPLVVVGDGAFDLASHVSHAPAVPKGCEGRAFSQDASRMSAECETPDGAEVVMVFDVRTGRPIGTFKEFQTAAPVLGGTITTSGNFVFWAARASGGFEEIKSHVTGPTMSSHSVMSPDEQSLFTTVDRHWIPDDPSPARVLDPHDGSMRYELPVDVDDVTFSPDGHLLAAHHSKNWADFEHASTTDRTSFTIHQGRPDVVATIPGEDAQLAAFSADDAHIAVRYTSGLVRVFALA